MPGAVKAMAAMADADNTIKNNVDINAVSENKAGTSTTERNKDTDSESEKAKGADLKISNIGHPQTGDAAPIASVWGTVIAGISLALVARKRHRKIFKL